MSERVTHIGAYRVERELLLEDRRAVFQGWQMSLNRPVQITQLAPETAADAGFVARWKTVARDLRDPGHPQVPRILDAQFGGEQPYLVESYIVADTLADQLGRERDLRSSLRLVSGLADALAYAHKRGWAHGCLGPEYVRIMEDGSAYVLDLPWQAAQRTKGDTEAMQADVRALAGLLQTLRAPVAGAMPAMTGWAADDARLLTAWLAHGEPAETAATATAAAAVLFQAHQGQIVTCEQLSDALRPVLPGARVAAAPTPPPNNTFVTPPPGAASRPPAPAPQTPPQQPLPPPATPPYHYTPPQPARSSRGLVGVLAFLVVVAVLAAGGYLLCRTGVLPFCVSCNQSLIAQYTSAARIYVDNESWQEAQRELQAAQAECAACNADEPAACLDIAALESDVVCRTQIETGIAAGEKLLANGDACAAVDELDEAMAAAAQCQVDVTLARSFLARNSDGGAYTLCALERLALAETEVDDEQRNQLCAQAQTLFGEARDIRPSAALITQHYTRAERFAELQASYTAQQWDAASDALQVLDGLVDDGQYCGYSLDGFRFEILLSQGDVLSQQGNYPEALERYQQAEQQAETLAQQNRLAQAIAAIPASALTPTATATPTRTPTPVATPTPFVTARGRIRSCPSTLCSEQRRASSAAAFPAVCSVDEADGVWYKLANDQGWVRSDVATLNGRLAPCPVAALTPTPRAVAAPPASSSPSSSSGGSCRAAGSLPAVTLSTPGVDRTCNGPLRFTWQAPYTLQSGEIFEVHIWADRSQNKGNIRRTKETSAVIDIRKDVPWINWNDRNRAHFWEVVVVCQATNTRISQEPRASLFYFETRLPVDENNPDGNCR